MHLKNIIILFFVILFLNQIIFSENNLDADSKITKVIVYPEWAYVTREALVNINPGITKITFKNLPPWIDTDSIQAKLNKSNDAKITGAFTEKIFISQIAEKEIQAIKDKITEITNKIEDLNTELKALSKEREFLESLLKWQINNANEKKSVNEIKIDELVNFSGFIKNSILANLKRNDEISRLIKLLNQDLYAYQNKWSEIQSKANLEKINITVELDSKVSGQINLLLSYLISGAGWFPKYEVRSTNFNKNINLSYNVIIRQSTGEDWNEAEFKISTIKPYLIQQKPELNPWYVSNTGNYNNDSFSRNKINDYYGNLKSIQEKQRAEVKKDSTQSMAYQNYINAEANLFELVKQVEERGATVEFDIAGKYSVKSDGKPVKMIIDNINLDAEKRYSAIPSLSKNTYVSCMMKNTSNIPLLPGVAEIYKEGSYIGKSNIAFVASLEKFDLYMGLEERIKVVRNLDIKKSSTSFMGNKKIMRIGFNIALENYIDEEIKLMVQDQIPVSENDAIKIKVITINPQIDKNDKGIITWNINLSPQEKKNLYFEFEIEYEKSITLKNFKEIERTMDKMMEQ
jgi:uncharacterized protein (TIGR02231 family)